MAEVAAAVAVETPSRRGKARTPVLAWMCIAWLAAVCVLAAGGAVLAPQDPSAQDLFAALAGPSGSHLLGTDELGRDIFSRIIAGADTAVMGPAVVALATTILSTTIGLVAGYRGGFLDSAVMRVVDLLLALPPLLVLIVVAGVFGGGYWVAVALLTLLFVPSDARIIRGATLEQRPRPYVEAARVMGLRPRRVMFSHILPNVMPLVVVAIGLDFAFALVALSGLSFLGLGVPPGDPDWGRMLSENRTLIFDNAAAAIGPAVMIVLTAGAANLLGDSMYERLAARGRTR